MWGEGTLSKHRRISELKSWRSQSGKAEAARRYGDEVKERREFCKKSAPEICLWICCWLLSHTCLTMPPHQPMVVDVNSAPTGISNLGCGEKGNFSANHLTVTQHGHENSSVVLQLNYEAAGLQGGLGMRPLSSYSALQCSSLICSACSSPLWSEEMSLVFHLQCFSSSQEHRLWWKGKVNSPRQRGADIYRQKSHPWSLFGLSLCKWGLQVLTVWLV